MEQFLLACSEPLWLTMQIIGLWFLADFITGVVHWWEDAYGNPTWPILGKYIIIPNLNHHRDPNLLTKGSYWHRMDTSTYAAIIAAIVFWVLGWHSWHMLVCLAFTTQTNEIHAATHRTKKQNGRIVSFLQRIGLLQRRETHEWHHAAPYDTNFCVMTEYLNPLLNRIRFWYRLERTIEKTLGIKVLRGSEIRDGF